MRAFVRGQQSGKEALDKGLLRRRCDWEARCRQMTKSLSPNGGKRLEAYNLHKKYMILPLLLVLLFTAGLSLGQSANNTSTMGIINV